MTPLRAALATGLVILLLNASGAAGQGYPYFAPGGALSCTGACTTQSVDLTQSGFVLGPLRVGAGGTGINTLTGLALGNGTSAFSAYAGTSCTNQFPRSLSASGAATCASVANTDLAASVFANPSGTIGLTATNGVATTADRSDSTHALSQAIVPTWTGVHTFSNNVVLTAPASGNALTATANAGGYAAVLNGATAGQEVLRVDNSAGDTRIGLFSAATEMAIFQATTNLFNISTLGASTNLRLSVNAGTGLGLSAAGALTLPLLATSSAATTGTLCWTTGTGNVNVDTTTTCLASSRRFKKDITSLGESLPTLKKMRPVSYRLKDDPTHIGVQIGLIAEEVQVLEPRLVSLDDEGRPRAVRYQQLTALIIKALQEQQHEIEQLQSRARAARCAHP